MAGRRQAQHHHLRFPNNLAAVRNAHDETQAELAERLAIPRIYLALWETGVSLPTEEHHRRLQEAYPNEKLYPDWMTEVMIVVQQGARKGA